MTTAVYLHFWQTYAKLPRYWFGLFMELVRVLLTRAVMVIILGQIVAGVAANNRPAATTAIIAFLAVALIASFVGAAGDLTANNAENRLYAVLATNFFTKMVGKDMSFYKDHQTGYLSSLFRQYTDGILELARMIRGDFVRTVVALVAPILILSLASWKVGLITAAMVVVQFIYIHWSTSITSKTRAASHEIYRKLSGEISDSITNIVAYKSSGDNRASIKRVKQLSNEETAAFWLRRRTEVSLNLPRSVITNIASALAYFAILLNSTGGASVALMVMAITYMWQIVNLVETLPDILARHDAIITKIEPALAYLGNNYETILDPKQPVAAELSRGAIGINHVSFAYTNKKGANTVVFDDLNLEVKAGQSVGIVGLSGSGKSTLASLLMRFDDVDSGSIELDGVDIRQLPQEKLRRGLSYVPQEPLLFHRSIRENIGYFAPDATDEQIVGAARAAHAHEFIAQLAQGYDTMVGERGIKLSGGQKQRVVIARAILKNAPVMIFDEATSALDSEPEEIIQKALPEIIGRRTAIVIAHRLSTVAGLDRIIVMEEGRIIEQGSHPELLKLGGRYYSLWQKQTKTN